MVSMVKSIIIAILLLPVAEIATFVVVAAFIGVGWAFTLTVATSIAGFLVLRRAGRGRRKRFVDALIERDTTGIETNTVSFLTVLAGLLLFLPGFLTDLAGAALLIGPVRRRVAAAFRQSAMGRGRGGGRGAVIDLEPDEWTQLPDRDAPRRPKPDGRKKPRR
jgi:UPF0716 protein FxsA